MDVSDIVSHAALPAVLQMVSGYRAALTGDVTADGAAAGHSFAQEADEIRRQHGVKRVIDYGENAQIDSFVDEMLSRIQTFRARMIEVNRQEQAFASSVNAKLQEPGVWPRLGVSPKANDDGEASSSDADTPQKIHQGGRRVKFNRRITDILTTWLLDHLNDPYPTPTEKTELARVTGLLPSQIQHWFTNIRKR